MIKRLTFILLALTTLVNTQLLATPTLTSFSAPVNTVITPEIEITLADLKKQGNESADTISFGVQSVTSGSLRIGVNAGSATAFDVATNFLIDANNKAFWKAASTDVGKSLSGFGVVANDNLGVSSAVAVQVPISAIGDSVTSIRGAFQVTQLTSVVIPDSVTSIGDWAFFSSQLTEVVIPNSVTSIGTGAFYNTPLTSVVIGSSMTSIGERAFVKTQLTEVVIPDSVTKIGARTFADTPLTSVVIGSSMTSIGAEAFQSTQLTSVVIPDSVTSIGAGAFRETKLMEVIIPDSLTSIGDLVFYKTQLTEVVIPDSVTSIGAKAFYNTQLTSVVIPDSVTSIGNYAFYNTPLTEVVIGNSVTSIGAQAFRGTKLMEVIIPNSVTSIGAQAFLNTQLTEVVIPDSVTSIGAGAFRDTKLMEVIIPDSLTSIGDLVFYKTQLTEVVIPNSVTSIGAQAFLNTQLTEVVIPDSVTKIGAGAFANTPLTSVVIGSSMTSIGDAAFQSTQLTSVVIPNSVTSIGAKAFYNTQLTSVVIPDSVTKIGDAAFQSTQLTSVVIPDSVTSIGNYAFLNTQLTEVVIPDSVTSIGAKAFYNTQLTSVVIPDSVTKIGAGAFADTPLTSVVIGSSMTSIGAEAFQNTNLTSVMIPDSVTKIGARAFSSTQLTEVVIPDSVTSIGANAFRNTNLTSVVIPDSVTSIGTNAFPLAVQGQSVVTNEDKSISITLLASDADGDSLTYTVVSQPSNGVLTGTAPNLIYKPNAGFNGNDSFTFKANDGTTDTKEATIKITITVNLSVEDLDIEMKEDIEESIILPIKGGDKSKITSQIVTEPKQGKLSEIKDLKVTYTPNPDYHGEDSFIFKASDGTTNTEEATVKITITPVNDNPTIKDQELVLDQDIIQEITFTAEDVDSETFTYSIVTAPTRGKLSDIKDSKVAYTPNEGFHGEDSFTYKANDGELDSEIATIILEITEVIKLEGDVNGDKTVNIFDLVMVASNFGKDGDDMVGDVNGDKTVNIFDLVMVASNFGKNQEVPAAPTILKEIYLTIDQKRKIESAIDQLESQLTRTTPEDIVLNFLKSIHPERLPAETQLLPNYPNPFNPETWIPFELHQDTNVSLVIYDVTGHQIRKIDFGYALTGRYVTRGRSIYWDGLTETGEKVSSGVYFYRLQAGDYADTRKMVILK